MKLSEELRWRGFVNQTTLKDPSVLDGTPLTFYWGVDPSSDSMTVGNLATAMMVRHFIAHGHKAVLLVGGATGLIGDPDGKADERNLASQEVINVNKQKIASQYDLIFEGQTYQKVDNYDWFKDMGFLQFLRDTGKHVPLRQMVGREFVQNRLGESGSGISYAEFSYVLIQAYDFLYLHQNNDVSLQVCGADQWGNSIAGVDLVRRVSGDEVHVWSSPLVIDKNTGRKFGKSEAGAIWLDESKTSAFKFYQFWLSIDDESVKNFLKIYTMLSKSEIESTIAEFEANYSGRMAQKKLAYEVTKLIHGETQATRQQKIAQVLSGERDVRDFTPEEINSLRDEMPTVKFGDSKKSIADCLIKSGLASSGSEARRLVSEGAIYINNQKYSGSENEPFNLEGPAALIRRGKAYKDSALIEA